jgi:hypothetical protein
MHKIKDMLMKELKKYEEKGNISMNSLDVIHKMTDTIKNIDKIEMLEDGGYSEGMYSRDYSERGGRGYSRDGEWEAKGTYDRGSSYRGGGSYDEGSSYANRGQHYVRGHYSRDDNDGYSERRDSRGRYSRDESKDMMMRKFDEMLGEAKTPAERETIKKCIETMQDY